MIIVEVFLIASLPYLLCVSFVVWLSICDDCV